MDITSATFQEDIVSNLLLGAGMVLFVCSRDLCKRISHSDCVYDSDAGGLKIKLPTWREPEQAELREV